MKLSRSKDSFCLMETKATSKIRILNTSLIIRRAKISPSVLLAHARMLSITITKYPLTRVEVKMFTIHVGLVEQLLVNPIR